MIADRKARILMITRELDDLNKFIYTYRSKMYELAKNRGLSDPDVIKLSQRLDLEILIAQRISIMGMCGRGRRGEGR